LTGQQDLSPESIQYRKIYADYFSHFDESGPPRATRVVAASYTFCLQNVADVSLRVVGRINFCSARCETICLFRGISGNLLVASGPARARIPSMPVDSQIRTTASPVHSLRYDRPDPASVLRDGRPPSSRSVRRRLLEILSSFAEIPFGLPGKYAM